MLPPDNLVNKSVNMFWDGVFNLLTLVTVMAGIALLVRLLRKKDINPSVNLVWGGLLVEWGIFNLV